MANWQKRLAGIMAKHETAMDDLVPDPEPRLAGEEGEDG